MHEWNAHGDAPSRTANEAGNAEAPESILVVDDNDTKRYVIAETLRHTGFEVREAGTGKDGLWAALKDHPDLIVLDVRLPDINGFEVCRILKSNPETATIPVLHLSAHHTSADDLARGLAQADGYLTGVIEPEVLLATIRALFRTRRSEEAARALADQWRTTFDSITDSVCIVDDAGCILQANAGTMTFVSRLPGGGLQGLKGALYADVFRELFDAQEELCGEAPMAAFDFREIHLRDRDLWVSYKRHPVPVRHEDDSRRWVHVLTDVTTRKRTELERDDLLKKEQAARLQAEKLYEEASRANRAKDEFLATLSHELRTPLNVVLGHSELLQMGTLSGREMRMSIDAISRGARMQSQLVCDLLDVSQIITGKLNLNVTHLNLASVVSAASESVRVAAMAKHIAVICQIPANLPHLWGDATRLQQVLWNLVSNAVKFTPAGGQVRVDAYEEDAYVCVRVRDDGVGIPADFLPHVFERFRQEDSTITRRFGGMGLGLAIVRHLTELHGGSVQVESEGRGFGSTFTVKLPHPTQTAPQLDVSAKGKEWNSRTGVSLLRGMKVLLVDDQEEALEIERAILQSSGIEVTTAASAAEALRALDGFQPEALVCDIGMPDEDGYSLLRRIRERERTTGRSLEPLRAIAVTGHTSDSDKQDTLRAGFEVHIPKPVDMRNLLRSLVTIAASSRRAETVARTGKA